MKEDQFWRERYEDESIAHKWKTKWLPEEQIAFKKQEGGYDENEKLVSTFRKEYREPRQDLCGSLDVEELAACYGDLLYVWGEMRKR